MSKPCDCCAGAQAQTPQPLANRPGLGALAYRVGTHATFLATMQARFSSAEYPALETLTTREPSDPSLALLDAWATVADVLTFYQERLANEGYLRTATERRSVLELARLVGYTPRPGVSASVYLAYAMEKDAVGNIPAGSRAQSVPGPGELPQSFETSEPIAARADWNNLQPRMSRPQIITLDNVLAIEQVYFAGTATNLKAGDRLLFVFGGANGEQAIRRAQAVNPQDDAKRTQIVLEPVAWRLLAYIGAVDTQLALLASMATSGTTGDAEQARRELHIVRQSLALDASFTEAQDQLMDYVAWVSRRELDEDTQAATQKLVGDLARIDKLPDPTPQPATTVPTKLTDLFGPLSRSPSAQPASSRQLLRNAAQTFRPNNDVLPQLVVNFRPQLARTLYAAWANANVSPASTALEAVYALRVTAPLFGYNAPKQPTYQPARLPGDTPGSTGKVNPNAGNLNPQDQWIEWTPQGEHSELLMLDNPYDQITAGNASYVVVKRSDNNANRTRAFSVARTLVGPRTAYGISGKTTALTLSDFWWLSKELDFSAIRNTIVYAQSQELPLAEEPIDDDIGGATIELDQLYDGLETGRWIAVTGERTDIPGTSGVIASELAMIAGITQDVQQLAPAVSEQRDGTRLSDGSLSGSALGQATQAADRKHASDQPTSRPGDRTHTFLQLATPLAYTFKRTTVTIAGNVVKATHGETRAEVLGAGDASKPFQAFTLRQPPLTYVSAPTPSGIVSTLKVYVNDLEWHAAASLAALGPNDRAFTTSTDDDSKTTVVFGDGVRGARLPTGAENIRAIYRNGIGKPGNVKAEQISLLASRPLGVKSVVNPLPASGGADKETRDQARANAAIATMALDRLVSVRDYADFTRQFAGIGKSSAMRMSDGQRIAVHVTIAGADDIPIDRNSDLFRNLGQALRRYGDPYLPIQLAVRELMALVISANVRLQPDYLWESVEPRIRSALLNTFSFAARELGQPAYLSQAISTIQGVEGVAYVDVDVFTSVSERFDPADLGQLVADQEPHTAVLAQLARPNRARQAATSQERIFPAQLAYLLPAVPDTLILKELQS